LTLARRAHSFRVVVTLVPGSTDTSAVARIRTAVLTWIPIQPETIEHYRATRSTFRDWLALLDDEPVGVGVCSLIPGGEDSDAAFALNCVLPDARRQGVGTAIYRHVSAYARSLGKSELEFFGFDDDPGGVAFAERHGFVVVSRACGLRLLLDGCPRPSVDPPDGITIVSLAERPELTQGAWELLCEAMPDIPYDSDAPMHPGSFEEFAALRLAGPRYIPEATFVAVHDGEVVGYGQLCWSDRAQGIGEHEMLAVRRSWRGRGIAKALKAAQISWALDNGLSELRTGNEERNTAARAVNARFPYSPLPDGVLHRGPLAPET
jgi:mycothiol synthase